MTAFIACAETQEAYDIANGTVRVYGPDDTHNEGHVWDEVKGEMPHGVWLSPCGNWRTILDDKEHSIGRNFCYCPFCKRLRAAASVEKIKQTDSSNVVWLHGRSP